MSQSSPAQGFNETVRTVIIAAVIAIIIRALAFEPFNIPSSSMVPGLLVGDYLFVSKYSYGYSSRSTSMGLLPFSGRIGGKPPQRGDVVVFKLPRDNSTDYIKRLIGLPGDTVQVRNGLLYINGKAVERQKLTQPTVMNYVVPDQDAVDYVETLPNDIKHIIREEGDNFQLDDTPLFTVPDKHYFMMGDNRDNSQDSRTNLVGFVPEENLVGRAEVLFFSLGDNAQFWQFWRWPTAIRWDRLFMTIK
jgi:signal peptidase I